MVWINGERLQEGGSVGSGLYEIWKCIYRYSWIHLDIMFCIVDTFMAFKDKNVSRIN
jgi:hypothetical protein